MSEPAQKCKNNAVFKQNYPAKLFLIFKMAYSCCFSLRGKSFITLTTGVDVIKLFFEGNLENQDSPKLKQ